MDDPIALEAADFRRMCGFLDELEDLPDRASRMVRLEKDFGRERIQAVLGSGRKELAPSERESYGRTNRSIHAMVELKPGMVLNAENMAVLRTEKILRPGLSPLYFQRLMGKTIKEIYPQGRESFWKTCWILENKWLLFMINERVLLYAIPIKNPSEAICPGIGRFFPLWKV